MYRLRSLFQRYFGYRGVILAAALAAAFVSISSGFALTAEQELRTVRDTVRAQPASGDIVIVEIDAQSLAAIDRWPWPRRVHGELVDRLNAANVDMIAFDVDFSSPSTADQDRAFADALRRSEALVLLPAFRQAAGAGRSTVIDSEPIPILRESAFLAAVNIQADQSGFVRRALLGVNTNGLPRPSLSAMLSGTQGASDTDFPVDYAIDPDTIPRVSYADILVGSADTADLAGKTVMIGATAIEMGDRYAVPRHGVLPGVVIQALAAETLLAGGVPSEYGPAAALLIALVGVLMLIGRGTRWVRATTFAFSGAAVLALPLILESQYQATAMVIPALAMLIAAAAAAGGVLALRKYRKAALEDNQSGLQNDAALVREVRSDADTTIIVGRIQNFAETAALLSPDEIGEFFAQLAHRLSVNTDGTIYRIDESMIGWQCENMDDQELADHLDAVATLMRTPLVLGKQRVDVDLFLGVAAGRGKDGRSLIACAAAAAERATNAGHRWQRYVEGDDEAGKWQLGLLGELDEAMTNGDLWVALQPKLDIASGRVTGAEALVRWQHPLRGAISPDNFIPLAEKRGRIADLTLFTLDKTLEALMRWEEQGLDTGLSFNVSAKLLDNGEFMEELIRSVGRSRIDPSRLTVEVTESAALDDAESAIAAMHMLRKWGIRLSVDDYGTGQSTLSYLKRLPADEIKIDKSFVQGLEDNASDRILIRSTIELAHELGLKVVAEGIENTEVLEILKELGCDIAQGFYIGRPMAIDEFEAMSSADHDKPARRAA